MNKYFRNFFGTYSPYADLIDAATNPPPFYRIPGVTGIKTKVKDIESLLYLDLKTVFFGGMKKMIVSRQEFVNDFKTEIELR